MADIEQERFSDLHPGDGQQPDSVTWCFPPVPQAASLG